MRTTLVLGAAMMLAGSTYGQAPAEKRVVAKSPATLPRYRVTMTSGEVLLAASYAEKPPWLIVTNTQKAKSTYKRSLVLKIETLSEAEAMKAQADVVESRGDLSTTTSATRSSSKKARSKAVAAEKSPKSPVREPETRRQACHRQWVQRPREFRFTSAPGAVCITTAPAGKRSISGKSEGDDGPAISAVLPAMRPEDAPRARVVSHRMGMCSHRLHAGGVSHRMDTGRDLVAPHEKLAMPIVRTGPLHMR